MSADIYTLLAAMPRKRSRAEVRAHKQSRFTARLRLLRAVLTIKTD